MGAQAYSIYEDADERHDLAHHLRSAMLMKTDFKWLMAGEGYHVDPGRLEKDAQYAKTCLQFALASTCESLRACAHCLRAELDGAH